MYSSGREVEKIKNKTGKSCFGGACSSAAEGLWTKHMAHDLTAEP